MNILVFRTSLQTKKDLQIIARILKVHEQVISWNVDLEDWENILRIEVRHARFQNEIAARIRGLGYQCEELED